MYLVIDALFKVVKLQFKHSLMYTIVTLTTVTEGLNATDSWRTKVNTERNEGAKPCNQLRNMVSNHQLDTNKLHVLV